MRTKTRYIRGRGPTALLGALLGAVALLGLVGPASALGAPVLDVRSSHYPASVPAGTHAKYELAVRNTGDAVTSGDVTVEFTVPAGLRVVDASALRFFGISLWNCTIAGDSQSVSCAGTESTLGLTIGPGQEACVGALGETCRIAVMIKADSGASPGTVTPSIRACGGGAAACFNGTDPIDIGPPVRFDVRSFDGGVLQSNGDPATQAGSHPHTAFTEFFATTLLGPDGFEYATEDIQDVAAKLPPGVLGNPRAYPTCTQEQLFESVCPPESQLGIAGVWIDGNFGIGGPGRPDKAPVGIYNMQASGGTPALLAFNLSNTLVQVYARVRTGEDYGVTVISKNAPQQLPFEGVTFTVWGVPADSSHDAERFIPGTNEERSGAPSRAPLKPFFTLPTSCIGPVETFLELTSWQGGTANSSFITAPGGTGCPSVPFDPTLQARPTTNLADSPSGLDVDLRIPQDSDEVCNPGPPARCGIATAHLKDTTVTLPEGLVLNPSAANGLDGCSPAEAGLTTPVGSMPIHFSENPSNCPDASKVATVEVNTPLLDHPVKGAAYIADPYDNPFNSLLALYIAVDDPQTGIAATIAGEVRADPNTGQLTTTVMEGPQLPFENFRLHFFEGAGGALRTPATCGPYTTNSELTPWTAPEVSSSIAQDSWEITQSPSGACATSPAEQPHVPSFDAGTVSPIAARHSPFVVHLRREDGSQNFAAVTLTPPQGLVAKLAGTPACPDSALDAAAAKSGAQEKANPSCPAASEIGTIVASAGAGPAPYHAPGKVYLSGPHKGAPLSVTVVFPATAGPFDLGTIVVKTALYVNSKTTEITAVADPIPQILQGIPLDVRTIDLSLDKPQFVLTGTSCEPMAVTGQLPSTIGQLANLSARFQLAECTGLGFKPQMSLVLRGGTKRGKHPALTATIMPRPGDANIASVSVAFPRSEFLENAHIRTVCTRPDFAADRCPAGAVYGTSTVETPLLDYPLTGNVYLRSSDNLLPDLVPDLRGPAYQPIKVEAAGRTDSIRGGIRNTFDFFPDAPFTKATLSMQGGNKGLLVNSRNICAKTYRATAIFTAHNGKTFTARPALRAKCGRKAKRGKRRGHRRAAR